MITSVVAAKIWYLKNVRFLLGHPVYTCKYIWYCPHFSHGCLNLLFVSICLGSGYACILVFCLFSPIIFIFLHSIVTSASILYTQQQC